MPNQIFLIRHAQSTFNALFDVTGIDPIHKDARLSISGQKQVAAARDSVLKLSVDLVVVSPLTRAIETGLGLFNGSQIPFLVSPLHRECLSNSCDIGRSPTALSAEFPMLQFDHLDTHWWYDGLKDFRGVSIEPSDSVEQRLNEFQYWISQFTEPRIAVVGHTLFFYRLIGKYLGNCEVFEWQNRLLCSPSNNI